MTNIHRVRNQENNQHVSDEVYDHQLLEAHYLGVYIPGCPPNAVDQSREPCDVEGHAAKHLKVRACNECAVAATIRALTKRN